MVQNGWDEMIEVKLAYLGRLSGSVTLGIITDYPKGCAKVWRLVELNINGNVIHHFTGWLVFTAMFHYLQGRIDAEERHTELIER